MNAIKSDILLSDKLDAKKQSYSYNDDRLFSKQSSVESFRSYGAPLNVSQLSNSSTTSFALANQQLERVRSFNRASEELQGTVATLEQQVEALEEEKEAQKSSFVAERKVRDRQKEKEKQA